MEHRAAVRDFSCLQTDWRTSLSGLLRWRFQSILSARFGDEGGTFSSDEMPASAERHWGATATAPAALAVFECDTHARYEGGDRFDLVGKDQAHFRHYQPHVDGRDDPLVLLIAGVIGLSARFRVEALAGSLARLRLLRVASE